MKAVVLDLKDGVVASASYPLDLFSESAGWSEQDPSQWVDALRVLTAQFGRQQAYESLGVAGALPCVVLVDEDGNYLRRSIQQADSRATHEIGELRRRLSGARILQRTGSPVTQQSVGPTLMWIARNEPEIWRRVRWVMGSYDYLTFLLTGTVGVERNWALESGLFDLETLDWAGDILDAAEVQHELMPPVRDPSSVVGSVTKSASATTGLARGVPVVAGSADHIASALAAGAIRDGDMVVKLGGSGDILLSSSQPLVDERLYLDFHLIPDVYMPNGCMASSGSLLRWFQRELASGAPLAQLDGEAASIPPGADGLIALPYFLGEKTPINDPQARGLISGLHLGHTRGHVFRSLLEGIAYGIRHHFEVFEELGVVPNRIRVTGGGSASDLWNQIIADVLGAELRPLSFAGGSALGVAFVAGMGTGLISNWEQIDAFIEERDPVAPATDGRYVDGYRRFRELYPALRSVRSGR